MNIESGVLVSSKCFNEYFMQTLTDSQWRMLVSIGAYIGEYGPIINTEHAAFVLRVGVPFLEAMLWTLVGMNVLKDNGAEDGAEGYNLGPFVSDVIEVLR